MTVCLFTIVYCPIITIKYFLCNAMYEIYLYISILIIPLTIFLITSPERSVHPIISIIEPRKYAHPILTVLAPVINQKVML